MDESLAFLRFAGNAYYYFAVVVAAADATVSWPFENAHWTEWIPRQLDLEENLVDADADVDADVDVDADAGADAGADVEGPDAPDALDAPTMASQLYHGSAVDLAYQVNVVVVAGAAGAVPSGVVVLDVVPNVNGDQIVVVVDSVVVDDDVL